MLNRFALSFVLVCAALTACTNNRSDDFSNLKNHVYQKILIDANQDQRPVVLNQVQREADGKELPVRMGLQQALSLLQKGEWQTVDYPISNSYDKGNPYSPFHDNLDFKGFYHPPLYDAGDRWVLEKGADVNASIEFWLAMDAIDRIHTRQVEHNYMRSRIGSVLPAQNAYGRKIHSYKMTYPDSVEGLTNLLNDLLEYGVDRKTAMIASHLCVNRAFVGTMRKHEPEYFKIAEKYQFTGNNSFLSEQEKDSRIKAVHDYYGGFGGPLTGGSPRDCDKIRDLITKDDRSPFWGDLYFEKGRFIRRLGKLPNQVVTTIRFDEPKLDVGLWQHLVNKDLYQDLGRVREEGLFSGLLYPDKAKFVVITSKKMRFKVPEDFKSWDRHFTDYHPLNDAMRAAYWMGDTMFSWYYSSDPLDTKSTQFRQRLSSKFGNFVQYDGTDRYSIAGCKLNPAVVSYQGDDAREFRKFYRCKMDNASGYGLFAGLRTQFRHVAATRVDPTYEFHAVFEFNGLTTDLQKAKKSCDDAEFKGLCEITRPTLLQEKIDAKQSSSAFTFEDAVAYTQISEVGRIEGVVLVAGFKFIYDLTEIAHWYQSYNPHQSVKWTDLTERFEYGNSLHYTDERY